MKDHPNIPALDIMKEVGRIWQNITKEELDFFKKMSQEDMQRYLQEHERFINEINDMRTKGKNNSHSGQHSSDNQVSLEKSFQDACTPTMLQRRSFQLRSGNKSEEIKDGAKRRKQDENASTNQGMEGEIFQGTPLKSGKIYYQPQNFTHR